MTLVAPAHAQSGIHVHVVARQIQRDQTLEEDAPPRESACQEDEQARGCATIRHHVEHGTKLCGLLELAGGHAVEGIEQAGYAVCGCACTGVERHVVERDDGEDNATVACGSGQLVRNAMEVRSIPIRFGMKRKMFSSSSSS